MDSIYRGAILVREGGAHFAGPITARCDRQSPLTVTFGHGRYFFAPRNRKFASTVTPGGAGTNCPLTMRPDACIRRNG